jgi:hypothetical protein
MERQSSLNHYSRIRQQRIIESSYELGHDRHYVENSYLEKVSVGKSTLGNPEMRVPPDGYDSTTDNKNIFVTYHGD